MRILDVIKTCIQTQTLPPPRPPLSVEQAPLLSDEQYRQNDNTGQRKRLGAIEVAQELHRRQGFQSFFRGLGVCSGRAFVVNAVQVRGSNEACGSIVTDRQSGQYMNGL